MLRSRHLRLAVVAAPLAVALLLAATVRTSPIAPIGQVRGAVATPAPPAPAAERTRIATPEFTYARATDPDTPAAYANRRPAPPLTLTGYIWPLAHGWPSFKAIPGGTRINDGRLFHDGIDLATFCGDRVRAAHDGVVLAAGRHFDDVIGWVGDLGPYYRLLDRKNLWKDLPLVVVTDDGNGYRSIYAHFGKIVVKTGARVHAGQLIGYEGMTGHASGCHVHFGLFSPLEKGTFGVRADLLHALRLPKFEIARINPILVLPDGAAALKARRFPPPPVMPPDSTIPAGPIAPTH